MSSSVPKTVDRALVLEFVNTQVGYLRSVMRRCQDDDMRESLKQLLTSLESLRIGLVSDEWSSDVI